MTQSEWEDFLESQKKLPPPSCKVDQLEFRERTRVMYYPMPEVEKFLNSIQSNPSGGSPQE